MKTRLRLMLAAAMAATGLLAAPAAPAHAAPVACAAVASTTFGGFCFWTKATTSDVVATLACAPVATVATCDAWVDWNGTTVGHLFYDYNAPAVAATTALVIPGGPGTWDVRIDSNQAYGEVTAVGP